MHTHCIMDLSDIFQASLGQQTDEKIFVHANEKISLVLLKCFTLDKGHRLLSDYVSNPQKPFVLISDGQ